MNKGDLMAGANLVMDTVDILAMGMHESRDYEVRYLGEGGAVERYLVDAKSVGEAGKIAREDLGAEVKILGFRWA